MARGGEEGCLPEEAEERSEEAEEAKEGDEGEQEQTSTENVNDPLARRAARAPRVGWETGH